MEHRLGSVTPPLTATNVHLTNFLYFLFSVGMIIGPTIGYIKQMQVIKSVLSSDGFSPIVSIILLVSNSLRVYFWFGVHFDIALLFQAIFMIIVQTLLVVTVLKISISNRSVTYARSYNCTYIDRRDDDVITSNNDKVKDGIVLSPLTIDPEGNTYKRTPVLSDNGSYSEIAQKSSKLEASPPKDPKIPLVSATTSNHSKNVNNTVPLDISPVSILRMSPGRFLIYFLVYLCVSGAVVMLTTTLVGPSMYTLIGYVALAIEACLLIPQLHLNYLRGSCEGLTPLLAFTWIGGDMAKMVFFIVTSQPKQFVACGVFQLCCDAMLILQYIVYRNAHS